MGAGELTVNGTLQTGVLLPGYIAPVLGPWSTSRPLGTLVNFFKLCG